MSEAMRVPKLCGADVELGNFVLGRARHTWAQCDASMQEASQAVLAEIAAAAGGSGSRLDTEPYEWDPQDRGRTFLRTNGGCAYIDLDHLELCLPEVLSAYDYVACWHAMLRLTRDALAAANARRGPGRQIKILVNNSDGFGHSYGSHLNVLTTRAAWDNLVHRKPHFLAYLAAFQASTLPITGQGKVGSENDAPPVAYQLSQRADFFETVMGVQTTWRRPLVNTRDEPLCGRVGARSELARLHIIFFDSTLCPVATLLRVGMMQIVVAMIEAGHVDCALVLDDPLAAVGTWSHDPTLRSRALLVSGEAVTVLQLQRRFLDQAQRFVDSGLADGVVPRGGDILTLWDDTLRRLECGDWDGLASRLDWVLKRELLSRALDRCPDLDWESPEIKHLDHLFSSLDPAEGLYWSLADGGLVEQVVTDGEIARFLAEPPPDTRAWARAMLLRRAGHAVDEVDWDFVRLTLRSPRGRSDRWRIDLSDPLGANAATLAKTAGDAASLGKLLAALGATLEPPSRSGWSRLGKRNRWTPGRSGAGPARGEGLPELGQPMWEREKPRHHDQGGDDGIQ